MDIGEMRFRVQIQTYSETQQAGTAKTNKEWTTVKTVWASLQPQKGTRYFDGMQFDMERDRVPTIKIIIRYQPYITTRHWVYMNGRRFKIRTINNLQERNRYLELLCEEDSLALNEFHVADNAVGDPLRELG